MPILVFVPATGDYVSSGGAWRPADHDQSGRSSRTSSSSGASTQQLAAALSVIPHGRDARDRVHSYVLVLGTEGNGPWRRRRHEHRGPRRRRPRPRRRRSGRHASAGRGSSCPCSSSIATIVYLSCPVLVMIVLQLQHHPERRGESERQTTDFHRGTGRPLAGGLLNRAGAEPRLADLPDGRVPRRPRGDGARHLRGPRARPLPLRWPRADELRHLPGDRVSREFVLGSALLALFVQALGVLEQAAGLSHIPLGYCFI